MSTLTLVLTAVGSVLLLLFLVMKARMHAFVALMVVSIGAGLFSGMPLDKIAATMEKGMGGTLGFLAIVVALGAMFGKILHETGAVDQIAVKMLKSFGHNRAHYAIGLAGLICALPLFFEVAIVLLISVAFSMARHTGTNLVKLVIPLFAGVAAAAAFLLPGPAPMLLASQMHADFGWMILIGLCAAIPGMIIAGPLWGNFISRYVELHIPDDVTEPHLGEGKMPSFGFSLALILLPLVLVGLKTIAARFVPGGFHCLRMVRVYRPPVHRDPGGLPGGDLRSGGTSGNGERPGDGDLRPRAAAGRDYSAGDRGWRRLQAGAG